MPFVTDHTWTPSTYRKALSAWQINNPKERKLTPRKAAKTESPRHGDLSKKLKSLLTWRAITRGSDWTAVNDNNQEGPPLIESDHTIRPRIKAIERALTGVEFSERRHAKLGGGGEVNVIPVTGDIEHGKTLRQDGKKKPECVVRLGLLHFSNGGIEERALVRDEVGGVSMGPVRIPLGGLVRVGRYKTIDRFQRAKGAANDNTPLSANTSETARAGAIAFDDPVAHAQHAEFIRTAVKPSTAEVLDFALVAANMRQIGERLGFSGKHAERQGKQALIAACEELDAILVA
ncbi:hypothetical protein [Agrobacterium pusense]|uniref:hypothetical protein n=1 Tax=Agrobacterium pusense TaxID=648995 RepID=UPI002FDE80CC